jgi:hypothetical protein
VAVLLNLSVLCLLDENNALSFTSSYLSQMSFRNTETARYVNEDYILWRLILNYEGILMTETLCHD